VILIAVTSIGVRYLIFCDALFGLNFSQLIDKPTHSAGNILDLVLTNALENISIHSKP